MLRSVAIAVVVLAAAPASAVAGVDVLVVGKDGAVVAGPKTVTAKQATLKVGSRKCAVGANTPLAALLAVVKSLKAVDRGDACSSRPRDAATIFVTQVGADRNQGQDGWVYKVGTKSGTTGAADPSGPFGNRKLLRSGDRVTWFWCHMQKSGSCQRTLVVTPSAKTVAVGQPVTMTVRGYDDRGRSVPVKGAQVTLDSSTVETDAAGKATLTAPIAGQAKLSAVADDMVLAYPTTITVR